MTTLETPGRLFSVPVLACEDWATNGELIAAVSELGYIGACCVDLTYGRGGWWTMYRPAGLVAHDLYKLDGVDCRATGHVDGAFDTVCFDPPYIESRADRSSMSNGTDFLDRYGIDRGPATFDELWSLIAGGVMEAARIVKPGGFVLVKCMAYHSGKRFRPVPALVTAFAEGLGLDLADEFIHRRRLGPGSWEAQRGSRRNVSTLLVFRRRRRRARANTTAATVRFDLLEQA